MANSPLEVTLTKYVPGLKQRAGTLCQLAPQLASFIKGDWQSHAGNFRWKIIFTFCNGKRLDDSVTCDDRREVVAWDGVDKVPQIGE